MPYAHTSCQLGASQTPDSRTISPLSDGTQCPETGLVRGTASQTIDHTASRRTGPRKWLRTVTWLIAAGLHPKANTTTQAIAEDLAARMDYTTGHVLYGMDTMATRLGIDPSNVRRHVRYLRELGALAWVQRGSRANSRRTKGEQGYAGTATVYAAVIPAAYDHAMGHTIIGTGYTARIIVDLSKRPKPVDNQENQAVDNPTDGSCALPSLTVVKEVGQVDLVDGFTTTAQRQRNDSTPNQTRKSSSRKRATILGHAVTAAGMQLGDKLARAIRRRVPWARKATHDQLRWVCADMGEQQWTEDQAVRFVVDAGHQHGAGFAWHPARPHRLIAAELLAEVQRQAEEDRYRADQEQAVAWKDSTAYREMQAARAALEALLGDVEGSFTVTVDEPQRTDEDRRRARLDWNRWPEVADHYADDPEDALDLYGTRLCAYAIDKQARANERAQYATI